MTQFKNPGMNNTFASLQALEVQAAQTIHAAADQIDTIADGGGPLDLACGRLRESITQAEERIAETLRGVSALLGEAADAFAEAIATIQAAFAPLAAAAKPAAEPSPEPGEVEEPELPPPALPLPRPEPDQADDFIPEATNVTNATNAPAPQAVRRAACSPVDPPEEDAGDESKTDAGEEVNIPPAPGPHEGGAKLPGGRGGRGKRGRHQGK